MGALCRGDCPRGIDRHADRVGQRCSRLAGLTRGGKRRRIYSGQSISCLGGMRKKPMFEAIQNSFAAALLDAEQQVPKALISHTAEVPAKRFAVYRNKVVTGLVDALARRFPAVQRIVGEEFFRAMGRVFVAAHPPRSPLLLRYGDDLPD